MAETRAKAPRRKATEIGCEASAEEEDDRRTGRSRSPYDGIPIAIKDLEPVAAYRIGRSQSGGLAAPMAEPQLCLAAQPRMVSVLGFAP